MLTKKVNGKEVVLTNEEEADVKAKWAAEVAKREAYEAEFGYMDKRKFEYPSIIDQLDMIYNLGIDGWKAEIKKVKDKYPKPE